MKKKGLFVVALAGILLSLSSFTFAIIESTSESAGQLDIVNNPWSQFGALGLSIGLLIWMLKRMDTRMETRDKQNSETIVEMIKQHAKERAEWTEANKTEADAINKSTEVIAGLSSTLSEIKGKLSK